MTQFESCRPKADLGMAFKMLRRAPTDQTFAALRNKSFFELTEPALFAVELASWLGSLSIFWVSSLRSD